MCLLMYKAAAAPEIDPLDLVDPIDILSQLPSDWHSRVVCLMLLVQFVLMVLKEQKKWSDRKDAVIQLADLANKPKLLPGDYSEIIKALKKVRCCS